MIELIVYGLSSIAALSIAAYILDEDDKEDERPLGDS